jgi:tetratricopeptide (TPR) repeat protein
MKLIVLGISIALLIVSTSSVNAFSNSQTAISPLIAAGENLTEDELWNRGDSKYTKGDFAGAIADFTKMIEINPKNARAYNYRGAAKTQYRKPPVKIPVSIPIIDADGNRVNTAIGISSSGDYEGAIVDYSQAIALNPKNSLYYDNRARAYNYKRRYKEAIADYSQAIKFRPKDTDLYLRRAYTYAAMGDESKSIIDFQNAESRMNPQNSSEYARRGEIRYSNLKKYLEAANDYTKAIELDPGSNELYATRAKIHVELKRDSLALADYTQAIHLNADDARNNYFERGAIYHRLNDYSKAIADYNRAAPDQCIDGYSVTVCEQRGLAKIELGDNKGAIFDFDRILDAGYSSSAYYYARGVARQNLGNKDDAEQDYQKALNNAENSISYDKYGSYLYRGLAYFGLGRTQSAIANFTQATKLEPNKPEAYHHRGVAYQKLKDRANSVSDLKLADSLYLKNNELNKHRIITQLLRQL